MKRLACLFVFLVLVGMPQGAWVGATTPCTTETLQGQYGFSFNGVNHPSPAGTIPGPAAEIGVFTLDREGNFSGTVTVSFNGLIFSGVAFTGVATVNPDCTGTSTVVSDLGLVEHFSFVADDRSSELRLLHLAPGSVIPGSALKHDAGAAPCALTSLAGTWGFSFTGDLLAAPLTGPGASVGVFTVDREGHFSGHDTVSLNGVFLTDTVAGTASVNPDCTGSATLSSPVVGRQRYGFVLVHSGNEMRLLQTDPGTVIFGTARRQ